MKLLVFSDTHGVARQMLAVVQQNIEDTDAVIYLGDGERDVDALEMKYPGLPLYKVAGNCDYGSFLPDSGVAAFGGALFFYTHGHRYDVKGGLELLADAAAARGATVALYGHTHMAKHRVIDGVQLFNPGSLTIPRGGGASYGVITVEDGVPRFEILEI